jgi:hypothetical protein
MNVDFDDLSDTFAAVSTLSRNFIFTYNFRERECNSHVNVCETIILSCITAVTLLIFIVLERKIVYMLSFRVWRCNFQICFANFYCSERRHYAHVISSASGKA